MTQVMQSFLRLSKSRYGNVHSMLSLFPITKYEFFRDICFPLRQILCCKRKTGRREERARTGREKGELPALSNRSSGRGIDTCSHTSVF